MNPDNEMLMAYADGELDPLTAKRVEKAIAENPALGETVDAHRALKRDLGGAFAPILDEPLPSHLTAMLKSNVVTFAPRPIPTPQPRRWLSGMAVAASLVVGVALGTQWTGGSGPVSANGGTLVASGALAKSLDTQLASAAGDTRIMASFRDNGGAYCRVFAAKSLDGIACKDAGGWQLRETRSAGPAQATDYRQAGSGDAALMATAQDMMAGEPLDAAAEKQAAAKGWR